MHEKQTIVTDVRGVCPSVCYAAKLGGACSVCVRSFGVAFAKLLWPRFHILAAASQYVIIIPVFFSFTVRRFCFISVR